jgi:ABC-type Fe3+ transport system substrate-binding protein
MKDSKDPEAAQAFLDYLGEDEAMKLFEEVGFSRIETEKETEAEP